MKPIFYMLSKTFKNGILDIIHHPLKCIFYIIVAFGIIYGIVSSFVLNIDMTDAFIDIRVLNGAYLALLHIISIPIMLKGLNTGTSFFNMSDVANIFVAPISEKNVLIYGVGRQLVTMFILIICFMSYGNMAIKMFDLSLFDIIVLFLGLFCNLILVQFVTVFIFCICNAHIKRASFVKVVIYFLPIYTLTLVITYLFIKGITLENFLQAISLPFFDYVPFIGWLYGLIFGVLQNNLFNIILFGSFLIISVIICIVVFLTSRIDYYEDVLQKTESNFEIRSSMKTGRVTETMLLGNKKVRVKQIGINKGNGASAIFFKHIREGSRRSHFQFFNINTVILIILSLVICFGIKMFNQAPTIIMLSVVTICSYIQFFFSSTGDWVKELGKPYIYLIPDSPIKKLIMAGATTIIKPFIDSIITFTLLGICISANIIDVIVSVLVYTSFGCVYLAANILAQRILGVNANRGIFITIYMSIILLLLLPGIITGILCIIYFSVEYFYIATTIMGIPIFIWNLILSFLIFMICKNLLSNIE